MTKQGSILSVALMAALSASASVAVQPESEPPRFPVPSDAELLAELPAGAQLEVRRDGDINGDGIPDVAFVGRNEEVRWLAVKIGYKEELDWGFEPTSINKHLDPYPLGHASLSVKNNVLLVEDLTGGTTATSSTYRYRWEPATKRMRLIGLDATTYSRTNSHDSIETSWNLLTGAHHVVRGTVNELRKGGDDGAYRYTRPVKTVRKTKAVYMEDTPDPSALVESAPAATSRGRD